MSQEVDFLFNINLVAGLVDLIKNAKKSLLLVSPYIDLDHRIKDALSEKQKLKDFRLQVLFGKNDGQYLKSIKKESLDFLMNFPNAEIRYNSRLHAKFYKSESAYIMTSMNLYDYSLGNNIEVGVRCQLKGSGLMNEAIDSFANVMTQGIDILKTSIAGTVADINPVDEFQKIFTNSLRIYETSPVYEEKSRIGGLVNTKTLVSFEVIYPISNNNKSIKATTPDLSTDEAPGYQEKKRPAISAVKYYSISQLCKVYNIQSDQWSDLITREGLVQNNQITSLGKAKGLVEKSYMGKSYIAYPETLEGIKRLIPAM